MVFILLSLLLCGFPRAIDYDQMYDTENETYSLNIVLATLYIYSFYDYMFRVTECVFESLTETV